MRTRTPIMVLLLVAATVRAGGVDVPEPLEHAAASVLSGAAGTAEAHAARHQEPTPAWAERIRSLEDAEADPAGWCPEGLTPELCERVRR